MQIGIEFLFTILEEYLLFSKKKKNYDAFYRQNPTRHATVFRYIHPSSR